jgi:hypothetical protein
MILFWDKVQGWQLSTTTMEQKGLTSTTLKQLNQSRGVLVMIIFSAFPLLCSNGLQYIFPTSLLQDRFFSGIFAMTMIACVFKAYQLMKQYSRPLIVVYGGSLVGISISILYYGPIDTLLKSYPNLLNVVEKESILVIACVQLGFMLYYLYSRRLVSKETVQRICRTYHPTVAVIYVLDLQFRDTWWSSHVLPYPMMIQPALMTLLLTCLIFKSMKPVIKKLVSAPTPAAAKARSSFVLAAKRRRSSASSSNNSTRIQSLVIQNQ